MVPGRLRQWAGPCISGRGFAQGREEGVFVLTKNRPCQLGLGRTNRIPGRKEHTQ